MESKVCQECGTNTTLSGIHSISCSQFDIKHATDLGIDLTNPKQGVLDAIMDVASERAMLLIHSNSVTVRSNVILDVVARSATSAGALMMLQVLHEQGLIDEVKFVRMIADGE